MAISARCVYLRPCQYCSYIYSIPTWIYIYKTKGHSLMYNNLPAVFHHCYEEDFVSPHCLTTGLVWSSVVSAKTPRVVVMLVMSPSFALCVCCIYSRQFSLGMLGNGYPVLKILHCEVVWSEVTAKPKKENRKNWLTEKSWHHPSSDELQRMWFNLSYNGLPKNAYHLSLSFTLCLLFSFYTFIFFVYFFFFYCVLLV